MIRQPRGTSSAATGRASRSRPLSHFEALIIVSGCAPAGPCCRQPAHPPDRDLPRYRAALLSPRGGPPRHACTQHFHQISKSNADRPSHREHLTTRAAVGDVAADLRGGRTGPRVWRRCTPGQRGRCTTSVPTEPSTVAPAAARGCPIASARRSPPSARPPSWCVMVLI